MRIGVITALAFAGLCVGVACGGGSDSGQQGSTSPTTTSSPQPTASAAPSPTEKLPPLAPFSAQLAVRLHAIRDKVSQIRGLPIEAIAQEGVATADDLRQYNVDQFAQLKPTDAADAQNSVSALQFLGLAPQNYTLSNLASDFAGDIAGFYDFKQKALVLVGTPNKTLSPLDELVLAHEYTHSLQDGTFNLDKLEQKWSNNQQDKDGKTDYAGGVKCLIEGDAVFTEIKYAEEVLGPNWRDQIQPQVSATPGTGSSLPPFVQRAVNFDYSECYAFVSNLFAEGGWVEVNAAFDNPPATSEQVLDIKKYHSGEVANGLMPADLTKSDLQGWTSMDIGQFGMFDVYNYILTLTSNPASASTAANGWGSGWLRLYKNEAGDQRVLQLYISFDSNDGLLAFIRAFGDVLTAYGVDKSTLEPGGIKHFAIAGSPSYHAAIAEGNGSPAVELLIAPDENSLMRSTAHFASPTS